MAQLLATTVSGNLSVTGTSSMSNKLTINSGGMQVTTGTATFGGLLDANAGIDCEGKVSASSGFYVESSRKVKENIRSADINAVDIINQVDVVYFNYIKDKDKELKIGFIAEDTPSLMSTPNMDRMDTTNCIGVLLKAVQELSQKVEELECRLNCS